MALIVTFSGEYNTAVKSELRAELQAAVTHDELVLDFSRVTYLDSTVLTELLRLGAARDVAKLPPVKIVIKEDSPVRRIFELTRLDSAFGIVPSLDAAIRSGQRFEMRGAFPGVANDE